MGRIYGSPWLGRCGRCVIVALAALLAASCIDWSVPGFDVSSEGDVPPDRVVSDKADWSGEEDGAWDGAGEIDGAGDPPDGDACADGRILCNGVCVDTGSDPLNCVRCGNECGVPEGIGPDPYAVCIEGECDVLCRDGEGTIVECRDNCSPLDECNGADDDCDGATDEDFECVLGREVECTTSCLSTGSGTCTIACTVPAGDGCREPAEDCNALDEDCDGLTDEDFDCVRGDTRPCLTRCWNEGFNLCGDDCRWSEECIPPVETCNGADDDCDGTTDNGFACVRGAVVECLTGCFSSGTGPCTSLCGIPSSGLHPAPRVVQRRGRRLRWKRRQRVFVRSRLGPVLRDRV